VRDLLSVMKALADANRLRIIAALNGRELCLCQIVELLGLATSTVSRHTSILQQARIVDSRKDGRWNYFRLSEKAESEEARQATALVLDTTSRDPQIRDDAKRLKQILKIDPEVLCRRQKDT
jgi:ArsR family transcriptional regulator, arsenate/arsenite/antimonite-responsive transcriptional repressor